MRLTPSRAWSAPSNWLAYQTLAVRGQKDLVKWNYPFERAGLVVKNKRLVIDIHDTAFTDFELKHLASENLRKSSGTAKAIKSNTAASGVAWEETFDNIPTNAVDEAKKAWSEYQP